MELVGRQRMVARKGLAEGVDRRRADIAEDDPDGADRQLVERALGMAMRSVMRRRSASAPPVAVMLMLMKFNPDRRPTPILLAPVPPVRGGAPN